MGRSAASELKAGGSFTVGSRHQCFT